MAKVYGERWETREQIGEGGQAHTYRVVDLQSGRPTAYVLKRLKNPNRLARFKDEVEALQRIQHVNVLTIVDAQLEADPFYVVSEYCAAGNLEQLMDRGSIDDQLALKLFIEICEGVGAAHDQGITHRDIKPANLLLRAPEGPAIIADFGICYNDDGERHTLTNEAVGARNFMAPEFEGGRATNVDPRCDVYSLGKVLYWLLSAGIVLPRERHREPLYDLVRKRDTSYFEHANRAMDQMMAEDPEKRLPNAHAVAREARNLGYLLQGRFNAPSCQVPQMCRYCGLGIYRIQPEHPLTRSAVFPFAPPSLPRKMTLVCDNCGNVQEFLLEVLGPDKRRDW